MNTGKIEWEFPEKRTHNPGFPDLQENRDRSNTNILQPDREPQLSGRVFKKQAGTLKFNEDQINWLRMIKDYVSTSFHLEIEDLDYTPINSLGGRAWMSQLFGDEMNVVINELNKVLAAKKK